MILLAYRSTYSDQVGTGVDNQAGDYRGRLWLFSPWTKEIGQTGSFVCQT